MVSANPMTALNRGAGAADRSDVSATTQPGTARTETATTAMDAARLLAAYPHVARCHHCRSYVADWLPLHDPVEILYATLAHHESSHAHDPLSAASQHFAPIPRQRRPFPAG
jgi:hypothetical protein